MNPEPQNPYATPASQPDLQQENPNLPVIPATAGLRFANHIIDLLVGQFGIAILLGVVLGVLVGEKAAEFFDSGGGTLVVLLCYIFYFIICESLFGRTLGKLITGTKVVDARGNKPSIGKIVGRSFARMIPFDAFSYLGATTRGWHDSLSGTYVVKSR